ncbi:hypothetical protein [Paenibacillus larvae]|uniref:hypothetical protein n=1 Tax=Paenibacillus larvae TaxID=1464 RepID=UPI00131482B8|nr:hypothetical protein [Paenibacillus larvae]
MDINELNFKPKLILIEYREMELDVISDDKYTFMMYSENMLGEFTREIMNTSKVLHWASLYGGFTGRLKDHVYHIKDNGFSVKIQEGGSSRIKIDGFWYASE